MSLVTTSGVTQLHQATKTAPVKMGLSKARWTLLFQEVSKNEAKG